MSFRNMFFSHDLMQTGRGVFDPVSIGGASLVEACLNAFYGLVGSFSLWVLGGSYSLWLALGSGFLGGLIVGAPLYMANAVVGNIAPSHQRPGFAGANLGSFALDFLSAFVAGAIGAAILGASALPVVTGVVMTTVVQVACMSSCQGWQ